MSEWADKERIEILNTISTEALLRKVALILVTMSESIDAMEDRMEYIAHEVGKHDAS